MDKQECLLFLFRKTLANSKHSETILTILIVTAAPHYVIREMNPLPLFVVAVAAAAAVVVVVVVAAAAIIVLCSIKYVYFVLVFIAKRALSHVMLGKSLMVLKPKANTALHPDWICGSPAEKLNLAELVAWNPLGLY